MLPISEPSSSPPQFKSETIQEIFKLTFNNPKTLISNGALILSGEYLRLFMREILGRATVFAREEEEEIEGERGGGGGATMMLEVRHLERVVTSVLLDF